MPPPITENLSKTPLANAIHELDANRPKGSTRIGLVNGIAA